MMKVQIAMKLCVAETGTSGEDSTLQGYERTLLVRPMTVGRGRKAARDAALVGATLVAPAAKEAPKALAALQHVHSV